MTKVTVDYPSSISRRKLSNLFNHSPFMLSLVHDMCDSQAIVLAAMCEGKCVTSAGNRIEADYEVTKLAAVIDVLENKFYLPVSRVKIPTASDTGGGTIQAKYHITENDMSLLLEDPESVLLMRERLALSKLKSRDERCLKRLVAVHGYDEVFRSLKALDSANDSFGRDCG